MILGIDAQQANRPMRSGTEWYAFYLIDEFKKILSESSDIRVILYCRDAPRDDLAQNLPKNFSFEILRWPFKYFWVQGRLSLKMFTQPPDILFCPAHTIPFFHPKKTFTTLHDVGFVDYPELYDKLSLWYHRLSARLAIRTAWHIFTVSEFSKSRIMENYDFPSKKISVTHLGVPNTLWSEKKIDVLESYGLENGKYLLFVGRLEPKKNILNIVKAFEIAGTPGYLVLAGKKVNIKNVARYLENRPELSKKIKLVGYVSEDNRKVLYQGASIFVFPTLYEGFGLPILEAQSVGTPVITSDTGSNPEIAGAGAVLVDPQSPHEISEAIKKLSTDTVLRNSRINQGFENIKKFDWKTTAELTLKTLLK